VIIQGYDLPLVAHPDVGIPIYPHQAVMIDAWLQHEAFLLASKTGSGKTAAWVMAYLAHRRLATEQSVICVYPTNELIRDQERSIYDLVVNKQGLSCHIWAPDDSHYVPADVELVRIDAATLDRYRTAWRKEGVKTKGQAILRLLQTDRPKIVLTNPDTLYLLFTLRYSQSADALGTLQGYSTVVFDEFHLYTGIELAHALFMVHMARKLNTFRRVVLLSATPHPQVRHYIERLLSPYEIESVVQTDHPVVGSRRVTHQLEFTPQRIPTQEAGGVVRHARDLLLDLRGELERRRFLHADDASYVPAVVIVNSVVNAIDLEDSLRGAEFDQDEIVPMRGLIARTERRLNPRQLVVIGTSAVEVGVDFRTDYLLFEATDATSFMQRLGRAGRHGPGIVFLLGDAREYHAMLSLGHSIERTELEQAIFARYPQADARAWFIDTPLGAFTVMAQGGGILHRIEEDRRGDFSDKNRIREWVFATTREYAEVIGINKAMGAARGLYKQRNSDSFKWISDYEHLDRFRTSLPSITVMDRAEQRRGRAVYRYEVDIKTLLERAHDLHREGRDNVIDGYERYHPVHTNKNFKDMAAFEGHLLSTRDYLNELMVKRKTLEGNLSSVSHLLSLEDEPHVFVFVSPELVQDELDWRLATFAAGSHNPSYIVAFDGDALLLKEIYRRAKAARDNATKPL